MLFLCQQHEVKQLRSDAITLTAQLHALCAKWHAALPDDRVRLLACHAAKEKIITMQVERVNAQLKRQVLDQQLYYASLQASLLDAPLSRSTSSARSIFEQIHRGIRMDPRHMDDPDQRIRALRAYVDRTIQLAPSILDTFTHEYVDSVTMSLPYSNTNAVGCGEHTLVANTFICKIPNATLRHVFDAMRETHKSMKAEVQALFGINLQESVSRPQANPLATTTTSSDGLCFLVADYL